MNNDINSNKYRKETSKTKKNALNSNNLLFKSN